MSQGNIKKQVKLENNADLFNDPELVALVEQEHTFTLTLKGFSMRPFLENERDTAMLKKAVDPKVGEPVLAEISPGVFVLHRLIKINGEAVTLLGDGNLTPEHCHLCDIKAQVVGFYRKGLSRFDRVDGWRWKTYSWFYTRMPLFARRYFLAFYRRWRKYVCRPRQTAQPAFATKNITTNNNINPNTQMKTKKGFILREICGNYMIVGQGKENIDFNNVISMNETAALVWRGIEGKEFTISTMVDVLQSEYEVDRETAEKDCQALAAQWTTAGIIE